MIVLDQSTTVGPEQLSWLEGELAGAKGSKEPAIVIGSADVKGAIEARGVAAGPASELATVLVFGHLQPPREEHELDPASAYFYDAPEENVQKTLTVDGRSVPIFGSGTLGYINVANEQSAAFLGVSGFLLAKVATAERNPVTNAAPVRASLIPNIGELALEAQEGTLLRRSEVASFAALARRPRSGNRSQHGGAGGLTLETDPYIPIPSICTPSCPERVEEEFTFSSEREGELGEFVAPNTASPEHNAVKLVHEEPVEDHQSGLFCALNATPPGHPDKVTITAGGHSSSLEVTIEAGSVRRPCGTKPIKSTPATTQETSAPVPPPAPTPAPTPAGATPAPVVPLPAPPAPAPPPAVTPPAARAGVLPFFLPPAVSSQLLAALPPPVPTPARPTPPSGASSVTTPVEAPEKEEEKEEATESVSNQAVAYRAAEHEPWPEYLLGVIVLAAFAGASVRRRPRRGRREVHMAHATVSSMRSQRRADSASRRTR